MLLLSNQNVKHFDLFTTSDTCTEVERNNIRSDYSQFAHNNYHTSSGKSEENPMYQQNDLVFRRDSSLCNQSAIAVIHFVINGNIAEAIHFKRFLKVCKGELFRNLFGASAA